MHGELLSEYVATIGFDVFKDKIADKMDQHKLKGLIEQYLASKHIDNYRCSLAEEIDFEGFCNYARNGMIADIKKCVFSPSEKQNSLKTDIINKAYQSAMAKNNTSKQRVKKLTLDIIDILINFYRNFKNDDGLLLITGEIERKLDDMLKNIGSSTESLQEKLTETICAEHTDTRAAISEVKKSFSDSFREYAILEQKRLQIQFESIIDSKRKSVLAYSIFPWFRESPRYSMVFPELFIEPTFKGATGPINFSDVIKHIDCHAAILGEAGAGKSTLLRYLFAFSIINSRKCIYITASEAREDCGVLDKLFNHVSTTSEEPYLVFIDGIDEEFANDYTGFSNFVLRLQTFQNVRFWLGCRSDYYEQHYNENLAFVRYDFTIEPWTSIQSDRFIELYSVISKKPDLKDRVNELICTHESLHLFKSNPFQLSLIVFLAEHNEKEAIIGVYDLYERFVFRWISREKQRRTSTADEKIIVETLTLAANKIYCGEEYILDNIAAENSAVRNLLNICEEKNLSYKQYATAFYHRSLAAFLLAHKLIESFLNDDSSQICKLFGSKLKDDVTNFVGNKFSVLSQSEKHRIKQTLIKLYNNTTDSEISIQEQIIYYITRLGIDVSEFLIELVEKKPKHPIMRLTIAYGCVLSDTPEIRSFALDYAKSISRGSLDAVTNRAWTIIYFGDVNDRDPYEYTDNEKRPWQNARRARIKRFTKKNPRLKDYRFRLFDIPLFHSFLKDRDWNDISLDEFNILDNVDFPEEMFTQEERIFLINEKKKLLEEYKKRLENEQHQNGQCRKAPK